MFFFKRKKSELDKKTIKEIIDAADWIIESCNKPAKTDYEKSETEKIESEKSKSSNEAIKYSLARPVTLNTGLISDYSEERKEGIFNDLSDKSDKDVIEEKSVNKEAESSESEKKSNKNDGVRYSLNDNYTSDFNWQDDYLDHIDKLLKASKKVETFSDKIEKFIKLKGLTSVQFYKAADIDRKVYSAMRNTPNYQPKKETAIACCFGLKLNLEEAEDLLKSAGYSLSTSIRRDVIIRYCLDLNKFSIFDINEILDAAGEKTLR